ncbi:MAG: hypothetical protein K6G12_09065 [Lachnospiraceae bacterium]|nr:hypothetical protein [Lachnospiraceae bacterium]
MANIDDELLNEVMKHLDTEVMAGAVRMSVEYDPEQREHSNVSHKCCKVYGKDASQMVGELDMYSDICNPKSE